MSRFIRTTLVAMALCVFVALPALADAPKVSISESDATSDYNVVLVTVQASGTDVYGMTLTSAFGSIQDIKAPEGWAGVTDGEIVTFHSVDTPIKSGGKLVFRMLMKGSPDMKAVFFDDEGPFVSVDGI